ncbi:MAG: hypothetical protein CFE31_19565 [Rhizobiales bacterium PAR1]|nr:MAG: hypothetical protein CFE31_19565 [Rhizobiales bacterium PAR1]
MLAKNVAWRQSEGASGLARALAFAPDFILFFGSRDGLSDGSVFDDLRQTFPDTKLLGCSTGGQFDRSSIEDERFLGIAGKFGSAHCRLASVEIGACGGSTGAGQSIGRALAAPDLRGLLVLSDGLGVNGSELVAGITQEVGAGVIVSGGLAGDGARFEATLVAADCPPQSGLVAAIGFYGHGIEIGTGSAGGWDAFGPRRTITRATGNVLYELDGKPALDLYERYLGEDEIKALPGSALLFPLKISDPKTEGRDVVRTILAVDREARSMTFAGDMPQGWTAELMRGNFDRLAEGAAHAARLADRPGENGMALMVSCIGRRLLMGQRTIDEVEAAAGALSDHPAMVGFYSYGEISPHAKSGFCQLHNQTMTVMTVHERRV